jgi:peptidyl-prolyl cis-trans isomerase D
MAIIGKIRSYSGLLIAIIGLGLVAFVLQDFLGNRSPQRGVAEVGEIAKNKISIHEFEQRYTEEVDMYKRSRQVEEIQPHEAHMLRQQTWDRIVNEYIVATEIEKIGITISSEELKDMFFGENPHTMVVGAFNPDPTTGQVNKAEMVRILQSLEASDARLVRLEQEARKQRKLEKYNALVSKGYYAPAFFAKQWHQENNTTADLRYVVKRYNQVPDSLVVVNENDMKAAYEEIKHLYKQDEMRDLEFVVIPVFASEEDREKVYNDVLKLKEELQSAEERNIPSFVNSTSDRRFDPTFKTKGSLIPELDAVMFDVPQGTVYGPYLHDNAFVIAMLNKIEFRPDSMSAAHVLIAYKNAMMADPEITRSYQEAKSKADSLVNVLKRTRTDFAALATALSDDPSASFNQGDLGWFKDGQMVGAFTQAIIENPVGSFAVAETEYGFHVIKVTGKSPANKKIQLAEVAREIVPSSITYQKIYTQASDFAVEVKNTKDFAKAAEVKELVTRSAPKLKKMDNSIPGIPTPRDIIRWAFSEDVKEGAVSRIFEIEDRFIIATVKKVHKEGIPVLSDIEDAVRAHALNQKKFELVAGQIKELKAQSLSTLAEEFGVEVQDAWNMKYRATVLSGAGREPNVIGKVINNELSVLSEPLKGNLGIYVVEVVRRDDNIEPVEIQQLKEELTNSFNSRVTRVLMEALKGNAVIKDFREWYY